MRIHTYSLFLLSAVVCTLAAGRQIHNTHMSAQLAGGNFPIRIISPIEAIAGVTIAPQTHNLFQCPESTGFSLPDSTTETPLLHALFLIYEYTGNEPPFDGDLYLSPATSVQHPTLQKAQSMETVDGGKMYYILTGSPLQLHCNLGLSTLSICGNGVTETGETCDDGNLDEGDGCNTFCRVQIGYTCDTSGEPSVCHPLTPMFPSATTFSSTSSRAQSSAFESTQNTAGNSTDTPLCGDGQCHFTEYSSGTCPQDCKNTDNDTGGMCGDGVCDLQKEHPALCPEDCSDTKIAVCGDGMCQNPEGENTLNCPVDCGDPGTKQYSTEEACDLIGSSNDVEVATGIDALSQYLTPQADSCLAIALLYNKSSGIRKRALDVLKVRDSLSAIEAMTLALASDTYFGNRIAIADALDRFSYPNVQSALAKAIKHDTDHRVVLHIVDIAQENTSEEISEALSYRLYSETNHTVQVSLASILATRQDAVSRTAIFEAFTNGHIDWRAQDAIVQELNLHKEQFSVETLIHAIQQGSAIHWAVREHATSGLSTMTGINGVCDALLEISSSDPHPNVRTVALDALSDVYGTCHIGDDACGDILLLNGDQNAVYNQIQEWLTVNSDRSTACLTIGLDRSEAWYTRRDILNELGNRTSDTATEGLLFALMHDAHWGNRSTAANFLIRRANSNAAALDGLRGALHTEPDWRIRNDIVYGAFQNDRSLLCGNGFPDSPEQCDDGNTDEGDGCSSSCTQE